VTVHSATACRRAVLWGVAAGVRGQLFFGAGALLRRQSLRGFRVEDLGYDRDVPQPGVPGGEHRRGGGQPRRQRGAVQRQPGGDVLGGGHPAAGVGPLDAQQVGQRVGGRGAAALGEDAAPLDRGEGVDAGPVEAADGVLAEREHRDEVVVRPRARRGLRVEHLREQVVRGGERVGGHGSILLEQKFE
jgi:hypothetical protein